MLEVARNIKRRKRYFLMGFRLTYCVIIVPHSPMYYTYPLHCVHGNLGLAHDNRCVCQKRVNENGYQVAVWPHRSVNQAPWFVRVRIYRQAGHALAHLPWISCTLYLRRS